MLFLLVAGFLLGVVTLADPGVFSVWPLVVFSSFMIIFFFVPASIWGDRVAEDHQPRRRPCSSVELAKELADPPKGAERLALRLVTLWVAFWTPANYPSPSRTR